MTLKGSPALVARITSFLSQFNSLSIRSYFDTPINRVRWVYMRVKRSVYKSHFERVNGPFVLFLVTRARLPNVVCAR